MATGATGEAGFVLLHGGVHRAAAWAPLLPHLSWPAEAVDLPGRSGDRAELAALTVEDFVQAAVSGVERTGWRSVTLVGHSLAGLILPEVAARLPDVVRRAVFLSCAVPPEGRSIADTIPAPLRAYARWRLRRRDMVLHPAIARRIFCNGMDAAATRLVVDQLCAEPPALFTEPAPVRRWPPGVERIYVLHTRDRALPRRTQRRQIANLGPCEVVTFDGPHDAFVSRPGPLAEVLDRYGPG